RQPHPHPETAGAEGIEVSENVKPFRYGTENPLPLKIPTRRYLKTQKLPSEKTVFQQAAKWLRYRNRRTADGIVPPRVFSHHTLCSSSPYKQL
ncbi:MAG: hypothetical protein ABI955_00170, partial [Nitrospirota bacterium]